MSTADANEITEMKKKLNIELACEQTYTPSAPPLYPSLPVLKDLPKKPKKPINQTNNFWGKLFLYVFAAWVIIGVLVCFLFPMTKLTRFPWLSQMILELDSERISSLICIMLSTVAASSILLLLSRLLSKCLAYAFVALITVKVLFLSVSEIFILSSLLTHPDLIVSISLSALSLIFIAFAGAFLKLVYNLEKKDIAAISTFIEDTSKIIFLPYVNMITIAGFSFLFVLSAFFILTCLTLSIGKISTTPLAILYFLNFGGFFWIFSLTLHSTYLALIIAITTWKLSEDKNALKTWNVLTEVVLKLRCSFGNLAYSSSFMSTLEQYVIIFKSSFNFSNYFCGMFLIFTGYFNIGTYVMYAMKKKDFTTSAKTFTNDILFKIPLKCVTYILINFSYGLILLMANFFVAFIILGLRLIPEIIFRNDFVYTYFIAALFPVVVIIFTNCIAFYTLAIHSFNLENNTELITIDVDG